MFKSFTLVLATFLAIFAPQSAKATENPVPVVATFSLLGDMTQTIGGAEISLTTLVGPETDAHAYEPTSADVKAIQAAKLVVVNGLGFEHWIDRLLKAANYSGVVVVASTGITPREMDEDGAMVTDPHAWQNLGNAKFYIANIASALEQVDSAHAALYQERAKAYAAEATRLNEETIKLFADIPAAQRKIITSHDAFGYFGAAYDIRFLAPAGLSTEDEPTAAGVAALIDQIKAEGIKTVFVENMSSPRLIEQLARDTQSKLGGTLYADALSAKDGEAPTYLAMFRHNTDLMRKAMSSK